jgi:hypothetical protein
VIPTRVKIGTQTYRIQQRAPKDDGGLGNALAYTLVESNLIVISNQLPTDRQRSVLIHEIIHALIYSFTRQDTPDKLESFDDWEHHFIGIIQEPLIMLIRDNPDLIAYLTAE